MGSEAGKLTLDTFSLAIPYAFLVFGKTFEMPLECVFGYSGDLKTNHTLELKSLTGTGSDDLAYDMMYLVEDDESDLTRFIISCILNNNSNWNGESTWWEAQNNIKSPS